MIQRNYKTADSILNIVIVIGWIAVVLGIIMFVVGLAGYSEPRYGSTVSPTSFFSLYFGITLAMAGIIQVAMGSVGQAILEQANLTRAILNTLQDRGSPHRPEDIVSDPPVREPQSPDQATETLTGPSRPTKDGHRVYYGKIIKCVDNSYIVDGVAFSTLGKAKTYIKKSQR